jgi:hypothetical protein
VRAPELIHCPLEGARLCRLLFPGVGCGCYYFQDVPPCGLVSTVGVVPLEGSVGLGTKLPCYMILGVLGAIASVARLCGCGWVWGCLKTSRDAQKGVVRVWAQ